MTDPDADVATVRAHLPNAYRDAHEALDNILAALQTAQQEREQERENVAHADAQTNRQEERAITAEQRILTLEGALRRIIEGPYDPTENAVLPTIEDRLELIVKVADKQDNERGAGDDQRTVQRDLHQLAVCIGAARTILEANP